MIAREVSAAVIGYCLSSFFHCSQLIHELSENYTGMEFAILIDDHYGTISLLPLSASLPPPKCVQKVLNILFCMLPLSHYQITLDVLECK